MLRVWPLTLLGIVGCGPNSPVRFGASPEPVLPPVSDHAEVEARLTVMPTACEAVRTGPAFDRRSSASPASRDENWLWGGGVIAGDLLSDVLNDLITPAEPSAQTYRGTSQGTFPSDPCLEPFDLTFGTGGSVADFNGDGLSDFTIFRPGTATWHTVTSSGGPASYTATVFGLAEA